MAKGGRVGFAPGCPPKPPKLIPCMGLRSNFFKKNPWGDLFPSFLFLFDLPLLCWLAPSQPYEEYGKNEPNKMKSPKKNCEGKRRRKSKRFFFWVNFLERNFGYLVLKYFPAELQWADSSTIVTFFFGLHIPSWGTYPDMEEGGPLEAGVWLWGLAEPFGGISGILGFRYTVDMISILFRTLKNNGLAQDFEHSYI